jgi:hypothetical protein
LSRESEPASSRPLSAPRVHKEALIEKTERNPDANPYSALFIVSLHEQLHRAAQLRASATPIGSHPGPDIHLPSNRRILTTGLREPESREPGSPEPESREPESRELGSPEPESREPGSPESGSPESSGSSQA